MTEQPWAVRLADITEYKKYPRHPDHDTHVAAELRRLHEVNVELLAEFKEIVSDYEFCDKEAGYGPRAFSYYETAKRMVAKVTGETE